MALGQVAAEATTNWRNQHREKRRMRRNWRREERKNKKVEESVALRARRLLCKLWVLIEKLRSQILDDKSDRKKDITIELLISSISYAQLNIELSFYYYYYFIYFLFWAALSYILFSDSDNSNLMLTFFLFKLEGWKLLWALFWLLENLKILFLRKIIIFAFSVCK